MSLEILALDSFEGTNYRNPADELDPTETPSSTNVSLVGDGEGLAMRKGSDDAGHTGNTGWPAFPGINKAQEVMVWERTSGVFTPIISLNGDIYSKAGVSTNAGGADLTVRYANPGATDQAWSFEPADNNSGTAFLWCLGQGSTAAIPQKISTSLVVSAWGGTPPRGRTLKYWRGRMVIGGVIATSFNERIYFSDLGNPESWPVNNFVDLRTGHDLIDPVLKLEVLGDDLWVFRRHSVWRITDPAAFTNEKVFDVGVASRYGTCVLEGRMYWTTDRGIYSSDGADLKAECDALDDGKFFSSGLASNPTLQRVKPTVDGKLIWTMGGRIKPVYFEGYPSLAGDGEVPWMKHVLPGLSSIDAIDTITFGVWGTFRAIILGDTSDNRNYTAILGSSYSDFDYSVDAARKIVTEYYTPWISIGDVDEYVRIRKILMLLGQSSSVGLELKIDIYVDWDNTTPVATFSVNTAGSVDRDIMNYWRPEARCRAFQLRLYTDAGVTSFKDWELDRMELKYRRRVTTGG
jgi:hypothetical protein